MSANQPGLLSALPLLVLAVGCLPDQDYDTIHDALDNCPATKNPDQMDRDDNGVGDVCEPVGDFAPTYELLALDPSRAQNGVTLFSVMGQEMIEPQSDYASLGYLAALPTRASGANPTELLPLWVLSDFTGEAFSDVHLLPNGNLLALRGRDVGKAIHEIDPRTGESVWSYDDVIATHSVKSLPDGNVMFIHSTYLEGTGCGVPIETNGPRVVRLDNVRVIDPEAVAQGAPAADQVVWDWSLASHTSVYDDPHPDPLYCQFSQYWSNCNAVSFTPAEGWEAGQDLRGDVYLNCRLLNRLYKVGYPSGDIEWVLGDGGNVDWPNGSGGYYAETPFYRTHDPHISYVEDDGGHRTATRVLLYDNRDDGLDESGTHVCPPDEAPCPEALEPYSRVLEIEIDESGQNPSAQIVWKWPSPTQPDFDQVRTHSPLAGGVEPLPGGHLLLTHATEGGNPFVARVCNARFTEIERDGSPTGADIVWDARTAPGYCTFKATRLPSIATLEGWVSSVEPAPSN